MQNQISSNNTQIISSFSSKTHIKDCVSIDASKYKAIKMMNEKELILLKHLRKNSRKSLAKVGEEADIPVSTLFDTLKRLEAGVIKKHVSLLDFSKMGYHIKVNITMSARNKNGLREFLIKDERVNNLYCLTNDYHFMAECLFKDLKEAEDFKEELREFGISQMHEHFVLEEIKKEEFLPLDEMQY